MMIKLLILALNIALIAGGPSRCALPPPSKSQEPVQNRQLDDLSRCLLPPQSQSLEIQQNPQVVSLLLKENSEYYTQHCVGTIINKNSVLTAASCTEQYLPYQVRVRVGSPLANSGGVVHAVSELRNKPEGVRPVCSAIPILHRFDDIGIVRTANEIVYVNNAVQPATFSGIHDVPVGDTITTFGFGTDRMGDRYPALRRRAHRLISLEQCRSDHFVTPDMICTIAQIMVCSATGNSVQDPGSPIYHDGIVVGVVSHIADPGFPVINTRVSSFIDWIQANA